MQRHLHAQRSNTLARFQRHDPQTQDSAGQPLPAWVDVFKDWGEFVSPKGLSFLSAEFQSGGKEHATNLRVFRLRWRNTPPTTNMRALIQGTVYEIKELFPDLETRRYLYIGMSLGANTDGGV